MSSALTAVLITVGSIAAGVGVAYLLEWIDARKEGRARWWR